MLGMLAIPLAGQTKETPMTKPQKCPVCSNDGTSEYLAPFSDLCEAHTKRRNIRTENYRRAALRNLAHSALQIQDASNLSGVLATAAETACTLRRVGGSIDGSGLGTLEVNQHPVMQLFAAKIADLSGLRGEYPNEAEAQCLDLLKLADLPVHEVTS
jgi:hypothetical protein